MQRYKEKTIKNSTPENSKKSVGKDEMMIINPNAAGIDIGSRFHVVAVPSSSSDQPIREFSSTTTSVLEMAKWLKSCRVTTIAMESTGSYWIPVYEILEEKGFEVYLVNAQFVKNVPGRKSDYRDADWIQRLHTFGLLSKSFRPQDHCLKLRSLTRQHSKLISHRSPHILHMQKALQEMNIQLHTHIRDITGVTGMNIITAILNGERDINKFAQLVHPKCKNSAEKIAESLLGNYRGEHLFILGQAKDLYFYYSEKIEECEREIQKALDELAVQTKNEVSPIATGKLSSASEEIAQPLKGSSKKTKKKKGISFDAAPKLSAIVGVDLTCIPGIDQATALKIVAELGGCVDAWSSAKRFASWMGLCPGNKISGGKVLSSKTKTCPNRLAQLLRMAANGLWNSKSYLGAFLRRMRGRLGGMKAITCGAHKLARIVYVMIKEGINYEDLGEEFYEKRYQERRLKNIERQAKEYGMKLIPV